MSQWLFDLGNTRLKLAPLLADGRCGEVSAWAHDQHDLAEVLAQALPPRLETAFVASVAGEARRVALLQGLAARCTRISLARTQAACGSLRIAYAEPSRLGVDRFLALLAARDRGGAALVVGVGTALTVDLLDAEGQHLGGRIAPSPTLMRQILHQRAPQLPEDGGEYLPWANDTADALASGCEGAALALIGQSRAEALARLGHPPVLLLHGGGAPALLEHLQDATPVANLVLDGLARWAAVEQAT